MRTRSLLAVVVGVAALLLAACAADGDDARDPTPTPPVETLSPPPPVSPPVLPTLPPPASPPPAGEATITGTVVEGVEPGCVVLETDTGSQFLLFGEAVADLSFESTVTVRGEAQPDLATTCQQGTPFEVYEVVD